MISPEWAGVMGGTEIAEHVNHRGYVLCKACSRGQHANHETGPCQCDLEEGQ